MSRLTVIRLDCGLGNQLFQIAFGEWLRRRFGCDVTFDASGLLAADVLFVGPELCGDSAVATRPAQLGWRSVYWTGGRYNALALRIAQSLGVNRSRLLLVEGDDRSPDGFVPKQAPRWAVGYWQGARFVNDSILELMDRRLDAMATSDSTREAGEDPEEGIAVHLRWGDYQTDDRNRRRHGLLGAGYFREALARLDAERPVTVFSESREAAEWFLANSGCRNARYAGKQAPWEDFFAMSRYRRIVIANSTFSWWAAAHGSAAGKRVIMPAKWYGLDETWGRNASNRLQRAGWIQVENDWL